MNLSSPKTIKELLKKYDYRPSKGLGQNFLVDQGVLGKILTAANLSPEDTVIEVGPGLGTLTEALAQRVKRVIAIEKDPHMIELLKETVSTYSNIEVVAGDALVVEPENLTTYKVVANIPYYLTSPLIRRFFENPPGGRSPSELVLMVQKEVAQRICSKPPDMSLLAVSVQLYAAPKIIATVKKDSFLPKPKIDSAIIKIVLHPEKPDVDIDEFFRVVKAGFSHPRKQLLNNLVSSLKKPRPAVEQWLLDNSIDPKQRAETLSVQNWKSLTKTQNILG